MSKPSQPPPKPAPVDEAIQQEALRVARRVQKPEQTKDQTKLIAQGIAKGIELYRKEQSAKIRERDKARKRALKLKQREAPDGGEMHSGDSAEPFEEGSGSGGSAALPVGGTVFAAMALAHLVRLAAGWSLVVGPWDVPRWVSLMAAALLAGLSFWFFYLAAALR